jgi:hypothetical protein
MDGPHWNFGNDSDNFTGDFQLQYCEIFLGDIVPWSAAVYLSISVIAIIANVLLLFAIYKNPLKCCRNSTAYFITNLSIADLLNSLFHLEELLVSQTKYKSTLCLPGSWGTFHELFGAFVYLLTFPSVTILALERYLCIAHPLWHQVKVTSQLCRVCIAVVWIINGVFTAITMYFSNLMPVAAGLLTGYPSTFYIITILIYLQAFFSIRKQHLSLETDISRSESTKRMIQLRLKNQNCFLTTVLIINIFLTFGIIPTIISTSFERTVEERTRSFFYAADILFLINIASNPFLYIWRLPKYRKTFLVTYCCKN